MATLVPMPGGVILHPRLVADWRYWFGFVKAAYRIERRTFGPVKALRRAIRKTNHGTRHNGEQYRQCHRLRAFEF